MACSLLRRHAGSLERCRRLVERSFGSYRASSKKPESGFAFEGLDEAVLEAHAKLVARATAQADASGPAREGAVVL